MISASYFLLSLLLFIQPFWAQDRDSLIHLYPGLGDTLDKFDRDYFELYDQWDENFKFAQFFIRDKNKFIVKVTYSENELEKDTVFVHLLSVLAEERLRIQLVETEIDKKIKSSREVTIFIRNDPYLKGTLDMFSKKYLYISKINEHQSSESSINKVKIPTSAVDSIIFIGESKVLSSMGWGFLIGAVIGGLSGFAEGDGFIFSREEMALGAGVALGLIGGFIGFIAGTISSTDNEKFVYENQISLLKLKNYVRYYFRYDKSVEQSYELME